jgi:hypothetical protein
MKLHKRVLLLAVVIGLALMTNACGVTPSDGTPPSPEEEAAADAMFAQQEGDVRDHAERHGYVVMDFSYPDDSQDDDPWQPDGGEFIARIGNCGEIVVNFTYSGETIETYVWRDVSRLEGNQLVSYGDETFYFADAVAFFALRPDCAGRSTTPPTDFTISDFG